MRSNNLKTLLGLGALLALFFVVWSKLSNTATAPKVIEFSEFLQKVDDHKVASVSVKGLDYLGKFIDGGGDFETRGPAAIDSNLVDRMTKGGVKVTYEKEESGFLAQLFLQGILPIALVGLLFFFFMRQLQAGNGRAMSFGKSRARLLNENKNKVTFEDVAGVDEAKEELSEIVAFLKDPKRFTKLGGRIPKGVLLMGPPGTGKTLLARAIAGEAGVPFFSISGSDFVEMFVGVGASRVRDLFEQAKKHAPCLVFIDEIDAVGRHRGAGLGGGHDEREQTLNQLLVEMDGFESNDGVILIAATNRMDVLDPALLRPGRFDRRVYVSRPDLKGRQGILAVHTRKVVVDPQVNLETIARGTPGFSGADLENLVNEAALIAARTSQEKVRMVDFESAKDKVTMGAERRSLFLSDKEKRNTAVHESGHTLVAKMLPGTDPVHKVTIVPRGPALGLMQQLPEEDRYNVSRDYATKRIAIALAGRLAEELIFGEKTSGASNDIEQATHIARSMVCEWGMSEKLGPLAFGKKEEEIFLGRDISRSQDYSPETAIAIDAEVRAIVMEQYERAKSILSENRPALDRLTEALLEYETLDGADVDRLIAGEALVKEKPAPRVEAAPKADEERREKKKILDALEGLAAGTAPSKAAG